LDITPWAKQVVTRIQEFWQIPPSIIATPNLSLSVGVRVVIGKTGSLDTVELKQSCLLEEVDKAVLLALNRGAPYPRLPETFPQESLEAYFWFNVNNNE
jgi:outer membrane biosynthesis protein TonB